MGYFDIDEQGILKEFVPEMGEVERSFRKR